MLVVINSELQQYCNLANNDWLSMSFAKRSVYIPISKYIIIHNRTVRRQTHLILI